MNPDQKLEWIKDQHFRADLAKRAIITAKKQRNSEYDERIRKLRDYQDALFVKSADEQQLELLNPENLLDPCLELLLSAPLRGLD